MRGVSQFEEVLVLLTALFLLPALPVARALGGGGAPHGDLGLTSVHAPEGYEARRGLIRAEPETLARQRAAAQLDAASNQEGELRNSPAVNLLSLSSKVKKAEERLASSAAFVQGAWKAPVESQDPTQQPRGAWRPRGWMSDVALTGEVGTPDRSARALCIGTGSTVVILMCMLVVCMFGGDSKHDAHEGLASLPASPAQSAPASPVAQAQAGESFEPSAPSPPRSFTSPEERRRLVRLEEVFGPGGNPFGACPTQHAEARRSVHTMHIPDLERVLGCSLKDARLGPLGVNDLMGLSDELVEKKDKIFGRNKMTPPVRPNIWWLLIKQVFGGVFNVLLWLCVVAELLLAMYMGGDDLVTPVILSGVIVLSGVLQWWTEQRAESMMNALQSMQGAESVSTFRRGANGVTRLDMLSSEELMPGDVIMLEAGHRVPADVRIVDCTDGALAESSAITGESIAEKRNRSTIVAEVPPPIVEANNIMWCGTSVVQGRLVCVVFGTGDDTLLGQIASKIRSSRTRSSLEIQIEHFVHLIAIVATCVSALSLLANLLSPAKASMATMLTNAATAFFTQVPEGLMPTVTLCLMIASQQMATRQVLVRRIDAVETLGCVGVLCSDKTGTLTSGHMTATDFVVAGPASAIRVLSTTEVPNPLPQEVSRLAQCGLLNSTAKDTGGGQLSGSPTEVAIVTACQKMLNVQVDRARSAEPLIFEIPFNSANKWMLTAHAVEPRKGTPAEQAEPVRLILKGAPERVIQHCKMPPGLDKEIEQTLEHLMGQGKRLLCVAERRISIAKDFKFAGSCLEDVNFPMDDYEFCGLFALEDPPKEGVPESIARMKKAGCVTVMVTGDHPSTAKAIAMRIGILGGSDGESSGSDGPGIREQHLVITGAMIESRTPLGGDAELHDLAASPQSAPDLALFWQRCVRHTRVFARVSPMHKRTIVQAYQHFGEQIVAMTGDGVNDAPALKEAEVGIAMGIRGTEVAKEAADIVLLDDNLRSVVAGMEQGRLCSENLRKSILYTLCSKVPQALPTFAQLFGVPSALTAAQVLLIDIGTDIWTAIAYACQPGEMALMETPPRHPKKDKMVNGRMLLFSFGYIGVLQSAMCWVFFFSMPKMWSLTKQAKASGTFTDLEREANYTAMTMYYWTLVMGQVGAAFATTTTQQSLFKYGLPNFWLNLCIVLEIALALAVIYWPVLQGPFGTRALTPGQLALGTVAFFLIVAVEEVRKFLTRQPPQASPSERRRSLDVVLGPSGVLDPGTAAHARQSLVT